MRGRKRLDLKETGGGEGMVGEEGIIIIKKYIIKYIYIAYLYNYIFNYSIIIYG